MKNNQIHLATQARVKKITYRSVLAALLFVGVGMLRATEYSDILGNAPVKASNGVTTLTASDTVTISSTTTIASPYAVWADAGVMTINGSVINQNLSTYAIFVNQALVMTGGTVMSGGGQVVRLAGGKASFDGTHISSIGSKATGIYVAATGSLMLANTTINLTGGNGLTGIETASTNSKVTFGANNKIILSGTADNWAMSLVGAKNTFDSVSEWLPVMDVSAGGNLIKLTGSSNVTFKNSGASLSNSTLAGSGFGVHAEKSIVTFENADTGGYAITIETGTLTLKGTASAQNLAGTSFSDISIGEDSVFNINELSSATLRVGEFGGRGTVNLGNVGLQFNNGSFSGTLSGAGALTMAGASGKSQMEFDGSAQKMSDGFTGAMNLNSGIWRFIGTGTFKTSGAFAQAVPSTFSIWANHTWLSVGSASVSGTLDISGLTGNNSGSDTTTPGAVMLVKTTAGTLSAAHSQLMAGGVNILTSNTDSFMYYTTELRNANTELWINNLDLAWTTPTAANAHGYFNVARDYSLDYVLADRTDSGPYLAGWDGKSLIKNGAGRLILHQVNTYTGTTKIANGDLTLGATNGIAASTQVYMTGTSKLNLSERNQKLQNLTSDTATTTIYPSHKIEHTVELYNDMNTTFMGRIVLPGGYTDTATILKTGTGTLTFGGVHSYTGTTWVKEGRLHLTNSAYAIENSVAVVIDGTLSNVTLQKYKNVSGNGDGRIMLGTVNANSGIVIEQVGTYTGTFAGVIENTTAVASGVIKQGAGSITLTGVNTYAGLTRLDAGSYILKDNGSISNSANVELRGGMLDISPSAATQNIKNIIGATAASSVILGSTDLNIGLASGTYAGTFSGNGNVNITGSTASSLYILTGNSSSYTGTTTINSGTLQLGNGSNTGMVAGDIVNNSALAFNRSDSITYARAITGNGTLTKLGNNTLTLTGNNTYTGLTTVNAGALQIGNGSTSGTIAGNTTLATTGTLIFNRSDDIAYAGAIAGTGNLVKKGAGKLSLTNATSTARNVTAENGITSFEQNGTFNITGNHITEANATTQISGSSKLNISGSLYQKDGSKLDITLGSGNTPVITAANGANISGTLNIAGFSGAVSGSASGLGDSKSTIIQVTSGVISGSFLGTTSDAGASGVDYITLTFGKSADEKKYEIGYGLAWNDANLAKASGTFTLAPGASFLADVVLADRTEAITSGWNGKNLVKAGSGTLTLSKANLYTGTTAINAGVLQTNIADSFAQSSDVIVNGVLAMNNYNQLASNLRGSGTITMGTGTLTARNLTLATNYAGVLSGGNTSTLLKTGTATLTLSGSNTHANTIIHDGTLVANSAVNATDALGTGTIFYDNTTGGSTLEVPATATMDQYQVVLASASGTLKVADGAIFTVTATSTNIANGGAVLVNDGGTFVNSGNITYTSNTTTAGNGGAIYLDGSARLALDTGTIAFTHNYAGINGGAIASNNGDLTITAAPATTLILGDNTAADYGGAIHAESGTLKLTGAFDNTLIVSNTARGGGAFTGGHLYIDVHTTGTLLIRDNRAIGAGIDTPNGGALLARSGSLNLSGSYGAIHVSSNTASIGYGGALASNFGLLISATTAGDATFSDNYAGRIIAYAGYGGGALFSYSSVAIEGSYGDVLFLSNTSAGNGGAIAGGSRVTITGTYASLTFDRNNAVVGTGGAITAAGQINIGVKTTGPLSFTGNTSGTTGGAIHAGYGLTLSATADALTLTSNTTTYFGGAFYSGADITIGGSFNTIDISRNKSTLGSGGAFYAGEGINISATTSGNLNASNNTAGIGGAFLAIGGNISIGGSYGDILIASNTSTAAADGSGGALWASNAINISATANDFVINNNKAAYNGGAFSALGNIVIDGAYNTLSITNNVSTNGNNGGGALYANGGNITIGGTYGSILIGSNTATMNGGAFYSSQNVAISATASVIDISNNAAPGGYGGAIHAVGNVAIGGTYANILITSNTSGGYGGAIYSGRDITIAAVSSGDLKISQNIARSEGAISADGSITIGGTYANILITSNTAVGAYGRTGALYAAQGININALTTGSLVIANNTASYGDGAFNTQAGIDIKGSYTEGIFITSNTTLASNGGAFSSGSAVTISATAPLIDISNNTAAGSLAQGGAIMAVGGFNLNLADGTRFTATNNRASSDTAGGFLYAHSGSMLFNIGQSATATIGSANSIGAGADSISAIDDNVNLHKTGAGVLQLWAHNTYTGTTFVTGGKLDLRGYISSTSAIIGTGATLAGTGTAGGHVSIQGGGHLAPGASPGKLTILGNLNLADGAILDYELGAVTKTDTEAHVYQSGTNDLLRVDGNVSITGTTLINLAFNPVLTKGIYDLINYGLAYNGDATNFKINNVTGDGGADLTKLIIDTSETNWIKIAYDLASTGYAIWDGANANWGNNTINGGSGYWYAIGALTGTYTAWTDTGTNNGEWLDGGFAIFKNGPGTITVVNDGAAINFSGAQFMSDGYLLTGGTLTTSGLDENIVFTIDNTVSTTIATVITGTHGMTKGGPGTLVLSGSNSYEKPTDIVGGTLVMTDAGALSVGSATIAADATLRVATGSITFSNTLAGGGLLNVNLASATDTFAFNNAAIGAGFTGTALFNTGTFNLNNNALANADTILGAGNNTAVATGTQELKNLTVNGGAITFAYATGTQADGIIATNTLDGISGTIVIANNNTATGTTGLLDKPILQQDENHLVRLIDAAANTGTNLTLAGGATTTGDIKNASAVTTATATYAQSLDYTNGLAVNYALTQLALVNGQTTTLDGDTTGAAAELHAQITGSGNLAINASGTITLNNANTYTGTTTVLDGTLRSGSNAALGTTSRLNIASTASLELADHTQTIGSFDVASGGKLDLGASGTLTTTKTGTIAGDNALIGGADSRLVMVGDVGFSEATASLISGSNGTFAGNVDMGGSSGYSDVKLTHLAGFGNSGTITLASASYIYLDASGTFFKTLAGSSGETYINSSRAVTLASDNSNYSAGFTIRSNATLTALALNNLGTSAIDNSGTMVFDLAASGTLKTANYIYGGGSVVKLNTGTLTIGHANDYTGGTRIEAGAIVLTNLAGTGTGAILNDAALDLAASGTYANAISGTGVTTVSSDVALEGDNTAFTGTLNVTGTATAATNDNIGAAAAKVIIATDAKLAAGDTTFRNNLTGSGLLAVDTGDNTLDFDAATGNAFTGTVSLAHTTLNLGLSNTNAWALANATVQLLATGTLNTNDETRAIGGLDIAGGVVAIEMNGIVPATVLQTGTLTISDTGASRIAFSGFTGTPITSSTTHKNFLDQDDISNNAELLIATGSLLTPDKHVLLTQADGITPLTHGQVVSYDDVLATYNYAAVATDAAKASAIFHTNGTAGIYYDYVLTELDIKDGRTLVLSSTDALDTAKTLSVLVTGTGNLELIAGTQTITLSHSNSYLGTTTVTSGTAIAGATDAFGRTSKLTITGTAAVDLANHAQTIGALDVASGGKLALGSSGALTLTNTGTIAGDNALTGGADSLLTFTGNKGYPEANASLITGSNGSFAGNVELGGAQGYGDVKLGNLAGLGNTGTITLSNNSWLYLDASGTFFKTLAGSNGKTYILEDNAVTLAADNSDYSAGFNISSNATLTARSLNNIGSAEIYMDATGTMVFDLAASGTLDTDNYIYGDGSVVKLNTGTLTIGHSNDYEGGTRIESGAIVLTDLAGTGTGAILNNAALDLAASGAFANTISGTGVTTVSSDVALTGTNTAFTGTLAVASTGTATITTNDNIGGAAAAVDIAQDGKLATTATTFVHALTGNGALAVTSNSGTFDFMANTGTNFAGTVTLDATALTLGTNANTAALANATLQLNAASALHTNNETAKIGGLTLNGGALWMPMTGFAPAEVLNVGTLSISDLASTVVFENYTTGTMTATGTGKNWLDQDNLTDNATLLVAADTLAEAAPRQIAITKADGTALLNGQVISHDEVNAIYNYTAQTTGSATAYTKQGGLYYDYVLAELNTKTGKTLALTDSGATDSTLSAHITGQGSVLYTTASAMTLTGSNTYTGTSTIQSGTVIAGANNALGQTDRLNIAAPGAFDLNGNTQTIANGGQIDGHLTGTGALTLAGGTMTITSANTGYSAATTIAGPATARLANTAALGTARLTITGTLLVDNAASGTLANTLEGTGVFAKTNTGSVTIATSNTAFVGTGTIAAGRVIAQKLDSLGSAPVGIAAAGAYELLGVTGTLKNTLSGSGTFAATNSTLTIAHANTIAATVLKNADVTLRHTAALGGASGAITLDQPSTLRLAVNAAQLGTLNLNSGTLAFVNARDTAVIATLGNTAGSFIMNANLAALTPGVNTAGTVANYLTINNAGTGAHSIYINTGNNQPASMNTSVELVGVNAASTATFTLANPGGVLEYDLTSFDLSRGDGTASMPDLNKWYLSDSKLSHAADAILNTASTLGIDWNLRLDSLHQRMGEVRAENLEGAGKDSGNLWIRSLGYRLNASNDLSGMSFKQYGWGVTAGADKAFETAQGVNLIGGFIDMGGINRDFDNHGSGDTRTVGIGAYATLLSKNGWFADLTGRLDRYNNDFEAKASGGSTTRGSYTTKAQGLSVEAGKRFQRKDGWWLEPTAQVSALWLNGASYTARTDGQRPLRVEIDDAMNFQYRAQLRFGRQWKDSPWHPYAKIAAVAVDTDGGEIKAHGKVMDTDFDGKRVEFGFGTMYRINDISQIYLDYEYAKASAYERPWSLNLGYRRLW